MTRSTPPPSAPWQISGARVWFQDKQEIHVGADGKKMRRLRARKCGKRTIIGDDDAEDWFGNLPLVPADPGA
jgi:hypothetical protein